MGLVTSGRKACDFKCIKQRLSGKGDASGSSKKKKKKSVFLKPGAENQAFWFPFLQSPLLQLL